MRARLHPGSENREHAHVLAREQARRQRGARRGPGRRDVGAVHQGDRRPVRRIEDADERLVRVTITVLREERHELAGEPR